MKIGTPSVVSAYETKLTPGEVQGLRTVVAKKLGNNTYNKTNVDVFVVKEDDYFNDTETYRVICGAAQVRVARSVEELVAMIVALVSLEG